MSKTCCDCGDTSENVWQHFENTTTPATTNNITIMMTLRSGDNHSLSEKLSCWFIFSVLSVAHFNIHTDISLQGEKKQMEILTKGGGAWNVCPCACYCAVGVGVSQVKWRATEVVYSSLRSRRDWKTVPLCDWMQQRDVTQRPAESSFVCYLSFFFCRRRLFFSRKPKRTLWFGWMCCRRTAGFDPKQRPAVNTV